MIEKVYTRLSLKERTQIESYLAIGKGVTEISKLLNRSKSTISREIKRGLSHPGDRYLAEQTHMHSEIYKRLRHIGSKLRKNKSLRFYVFRRLALGWTPEQVANRIKIDYPSNVGMRISHESIYKFIYTEAQGKTRQRLIALLAYKRPKRMGGPKRKIYMGNIIDRVSIDERPESVESRKEAGHWEGDLIIGKGQTSAVGTLVERMLRYVIIVPLESRISKHVVKSFANSLSGFPEGLLKTLTYDNGVEMAAHKAFTLQTKMAVYFAHAYSSWERGTNENTNGLIRRVFGKKTDFNKVKPEQLKELQDRLNNRPRKVLGWKTPNEALAEL